MKAILSFAIAITVGITLAVAQPSNPSNRANHRLDLVALRPTNQPLVESGHDDELGLKTWFRPAPPADSKHAATAPFEVTLTSVDRQTYARRETMIVELRLKNISGRTIAFPWTIERGVKSTMPQAHMLVISLFFDDAVMGRQDFGLQTVFGAEPVPGSLRFVNPGETVEIRTSAPIFLQRPWPGMSEGSWSREVRVKARVKLASRDTYYAPGVSQNELTVRLSAK